MSVIMRDLAMNIRRGCPALSVATILVSCGSALAAIPGLTPQKQWDLDGYVKYMATYTIPEVSANTLDHLIHQRVNFEYRFSPNWQVNLGMRNRALWGDALDNPFYARLIEADSGYMDLSHNWREDKVIVNSQFDRLYLTWRHQDWSARAGRFRINWSMNTVWNPNDIYNAYSIYDFDYEERAGTDAVLLNKKLGFADGLELVFSPASDSEENSASLRYFANSQGWDYQIIAGKARTDYVLGAGFATDILEAGVRGELSWFDPAEPDKPEQQALSTTVASIEADYSYGGKRNWMGRLAWLYISQPLVAFSARAFLSLPLDAKTLSFTRNTFYADCSFDLTALNRLTFSGSYYDDHSYFLGLSSNYSLADNWQLLAVLQHFNGYATSVFGETPANLLFVNVKFSY
ncbi:hypothetical protein [Vibrio sp. CAU 1672]|uniref:hypothetical protein n=1 Tax=Vibrio sp. CAU 1672 TaxID=3032594 RepID=UPI0023DC4CAF|nr:hypothetical protein [Vibrio sp. CAU 1672]MDF2152776.1 hypothetical protein [Vibrio sp. CAU 1672]